MQVSNFTRIPTTTTTTQEEKHMRRKFPYHPHRKKPLASQPAKGTKNHKTRVCETRVCQPEWNGNPTRRVGRRNAELLQQLFFHNGHPTTTTTTHAADHHHHHGHNETAVETPPAMQKQQRQSLIRLPSDRGEKELLGTYHAALFFLASSSQRSEPPPLARLARWVLPQRDR